MILNSVELWNEFLLAKVQMNVNLNYLKIKYIKLVGLTLHYDMV